jgi:7-cyano-7-deazaguanine synthase in queuosine biosynthesis
VTAYEVLTDPGQQPAASTDVALDWVPGSAAANIECMPSFFTGWRPTRAAGDLFLVGAAAYCMDKISARADAPDAWTRQLQLRFPAREPAGFNDSTLPQALRFLTGDHWQLAAHSQPADPLAALPPLAAEPSRITTVDAVSLFSGGLDSLCGVIDLLESDSLLRLGLVSHYDGGQATSKQPQLHARLAEYYGADRVLLRRLWLRPAPENARQRAPSPQVAETTTRGRSFLFLTAALALASASGPSVPVYLPENGYIAVNVPLTRARNGSSSTRTTHPHYLKLLSDAASTVGVSNPLINPYRYKTKGQMLQDSKNQALLHELTSDTVSCSHPEAARMRQRLQGNCGYCFPCLIRRAALATVGWDTETLAWDALAEPALVENVSERRGADLRAVLNGAFAERPDTDLLRNAPLPPGSHQDYLTVWRRGNEELRTWLAEGATGPLAQAVARLS